MRLLRRTSKTEIIQSKAQKKRNVELIIVFVSLFYLIYLLPRRLDGSIPIYAQLALPICLKI
jgi:hypothetical protein